MSNPDIVIATGIFPPDMGGPATYSARLASELTNKRINVAVITYSDPKTQKVQDKNAPYQVIRVPRNLPLPIRYFLYTWKLLLLAKKTKLILAQDPISSGVPVYCVHLISKKPYTVKVVGDASWEYAQNNKLTSDSLDDFQNQQPPNYIVTLLRKTQEKICKKSKHVIVPSEYVKKIVKQWNIEETKVIIMKNAADIYLQKENRSLVRKELNISGSPILISVGRLVSWKGFNTLIELMPHIVKSHPQVKLLIIGSGPEEADLSLLIRKLKLETVVRLVGQVTHTIVQRYYRAADLFVLNTNYEGLSHVLLEVMAAETPIITTNTGGNPEVITSNKNGLLITYNSKKELGEAILFLLENPTYASTLAKNALTTLPDWNWNRLGKEMYEYVMQYGSVAKCNKSYS